MEYQEGEFVLCTVERIEKTIVFVTLDNGKEGTIVTSEIAAGRIRNIRDYVVPKKRIVCKVLRVSPNTIELSLRRVSQKETKDVLNEAKQEKSYESIFKSVIGEKAVELINQIKKEERFYDFIIECKENPKKLEKLVGLENSNKILELITTQKERKVYIKKEINLKTRHPEGIELLKEMLDFSNVEIKYISAGKYSLILESNDPKIGEQKMKECLDEIEKRAKSKGAEFKLIEK